MIQTIRKVNEDSPSFLDRPSSLTETRSDEIGRKPPRHKLYCGPFAAVPLNRWL